MITTMHPTDTNYVPVVRRNIGLPPPIVMQPPPVFRLTNMSQSPMWVNRGIGRYKVEPGQTFKIHRPHRRDWRYRLFNGDGLWADWFIKYDRSGWMV